MFYINKVFDPARNFVKGINKRLKVNIPKDIGNTIGGVVAKLCKESGEHLEDGKTLKVADAESLSYLWTEN